MICFQIRRKTFASSTVQILTLIGCATFFIGKTTYWSNTLVAKLSGVVMARSTIAEEALIADEPEKTLKLLSAV